MVEIVRTRSTKKLLHVYVEKSTLDKIEVLSERQNSTKAEVVRNILRKGVESC